MDAAEADRLTRDFAQYARLDAKSQSKVPPHWGNATVLTISALFALVFVGGIAIALS